MSTGPIRDLPGLTNPITHAGRVVYNARRDFLETRDRKHKRATRDNVYDNGKFGDDESHTIQQYELCMRNKRRKYKSWSPNDTDVQVFSSANGLQVTKQEVRQAVGPAAAASEKDRIKVARDNLQFMGVASNRAIYDPRNDANEEHLAVQVGGLQTVYNTGNQIIHAGDIILWDMPILDPAGAPVNRIPGVPRGKKLFATVPYKPGVDLRDAVKDALIAQWVGTPRLAQRVRDRIDVALRRNAATGLLEFDDSPLAAADVAMDSLSTVIAKATHDIQRRVMGRALSSSEPGKPFDILLGHYLV